MRLFILLSFITLSSCSALQHYTNTNASGQQFFNTHPERAEKYNQGVKVITKRDTIGCSELKKVSAKDNMFDSGKKNALLYLKRTVMRTGGDAVVIRKYTRPSATSHMVLGVAYKCGDLPSAKQKNPVADKIESDSDEGFLQ